MVISQRLSFILLHHMQTAFSCKQFFPAAVDDPGFPGDQPV
jgi:hypothetical protein